eukprot:157849-Chlamydomonas_euryale.AAC.5
MLCPACVDVPFVAQAFLNTCPRWVRNVCPSYQAQEMGSSPSRGQGHEGTRQVGGRQQHGPASVTACVVFAPQLLHDKWADQGCLQACLHAHRVGYFHATTEFGLALRWFIVQPIRYPSMAAMPPCLFTAS